MIIVEQDGTYAVNYDNVEVITVAVNKEEREYAIIAERVSDNKVIMGIYNTEKRAKEVLEEIIIAYDDFESYKYISVTYKEELEKRLCKRYNSCTTYKMPKE